MEEKEDSLFKWQYYEKMSVSEIYGYDREEKMPLQSNFCDIPPSEEEDEIDNENSTSSINILTIPESQIA